MNSRIEIVSSKRDNMERRTNKGHDSMVTPQPLSPAAMSRLSALNTEAVTSTIQPAPPKAPLHKMVEVDKNLADHGEDLTLRYAQQILREQKVPLSVDLGPRESVASRESAGEEGYKGLSTVRREESIKNMDYSEKLTILEVNAQSKERAQKSLYDYMVSDTAVQPKSEFERKFDKNAILIPQQGTLNKSFRSQFQSCKWTRTQTIMEQTRYNVNSPVAFSPSILDYLQDNGTPVAATGLHRTAKAPLTP